MKRALPLIVVAVVVLIAAILFFSRSAATPPESDFEPFSARDGEEVVAEVPVDPDDPSKGVRKTTTKTVRKLVDRPDEALNRIGPTGQDAMDRRIVNKRPRTDSDPPAGSEPAAAGALGKEDVRKGIEAVRPLVKVCYEDTLEEFPDAAGKVTIGFRIIGEGDKGRVEMTELADDGTTLFDEKLHDCLQKRVAEAEFESPSGGGAVDVRYPFVFSNDADE